MHYSPRRKMRVVQAFILLTPFLIMFANLPLMSLGAVLQPQLLVEEAQRAFQSGNFSEAVVQWQQAVELLQKQGKTNSAIETSVSLAAALQSAGQQRRAVETLTAALAGAETTHKRSLITLVKSKLGAALVLTAETDRARGLLQEA